MLALLGWWVIGEAYTVGDKEYGDRELKLIACQAQIFFHAKQTSIANVDYNMLDTSLVSRVEWHTSIHHVHQINPHNHRNDAIVKLSEDSPLSLLINILIVLTTRLLNASRLSLHVRARRRVGTRRLLMSGDIVMGCHLGYQVDV